ncbi:small heat shock protein (HSP20) family [Rhizoctonia solani]|uniref:Small heat shock protein (HSP20) family n=1 Tax=Rhizoctonia solani TaxID=456999 RepID=A0A8H7IB70_9AGAM|nr:small heat shock protein (HSP20) family [Rhizoctonia solani]
MSLTRSLLNDFRPLFRMIEDPFFSSPSVFPRYARSDAWQPFAALQRQAAVEVTEDGNDVVVHAEMPGVKKENLDVHLSNDGQSLTIEGHVHRISQAPATPAADSDQTTPTTLLPLPSPRAPHKSSDSSSAVASTSGQSEFRSSFTRTLWLPEPVDGKRASAQLNDGILTLRIPKREHPAPEKIVIN